MQLDGKLLRKAGIFGVVVAELVAYVGGGLAIGYLLDAKLRTKPVLLVLFVVIGFIFAMMRIRYWYDKETKNN